MENGLLCSPVELVTMLTSFSTDTSNSEWTNCKHSYFSVKWGTMTFCQNKTHASSLVANISASRQSTFYVYDNVILVMVSGIALWCWEISLLCSLAQYKYKKEIVRLCSWAGKFRLIQNYGYNHEYVTPQESLM